MADSVLRDEYISMYRDPADIISEVSDDSDLALNHPLPNVPPPPPVSQNGTSNSSGLGLLDQRLSQERRRKLDIVNRLHSLGTQLDIDIPQIVVIGSQSAGKSSLIESISGITLPRASGTCTRCPTECFLVRSDKPWECEVSIRFLTDAFGRTLQTVRNVFFGPPIRDQKDVEERIRNAQRAALNPDLDARSFLLGDAVDLPQKNALNFTINCVSLKISGPDVADLSFCDLPGLIASVSDGREEDIENVRDLVESYIVKPTCIILLTVACESDFETQGAHLLAKRHDPKGERTIGVLTKPDRISIGEEVRWIRLIKNESAPLVNGWYCVKQPSSMELQEIGLTSREVRRRGEAYFNNPPWSTLDQNHRNKLGTQALTIKLHEYLMTMISNRFPELMEELQIVLQRTKAELQKLPAPAFKDPVMEVMHLIGDFSDDIFSHAEGATHRIPGFSGQKGGNQFELIRDAHEAFRKKMRSTVPNFRPFDGPPINSRPGTPIRSLVPTLAVTPIAEPYDEPAFSSWQPGTPIRSLVPTRAVTPIAEPYGEPAFLSSEETTVLLPSKGPIYLDDVVNRVQKATTRELPGYFPFEVIQDLIFSSSSQWKEPALALVEEVYSIVFEHHRKLIKRHFGKYAAGGLPRSVLGIVQVYTEKRRDEAIERVKWLLELEAHVHTLNHHYLGDYRNKFLAHFKNQRQAHLGHYHSATPEPWDSSQDGLEIMATVRAYFQVAYKRVVDTLTLAIDHELVRVKKREVQEAISSSLEITSAEAQQRCERLLAEPTEVVERREELRSRLERLMKAQIELQMDT